MNKYIIIVILASLFACNNAADKKTILEEKPVEKKSETPVNNQGTSIDLPSIPKELVVELYKNCDYTDYIFNHVNFSISQDNKNSIKAGVGFISTQTQKNKPEGCQSIGRKFFHVNGVIILEAEVYFSENCTYYIFYQDGVAKYSNKMTAEGLKFYTNIIQTGKKQAKEMFQNQ